MNNINLLKDLLECELDTNTNKMVINGLSIPILKIGKIYESEKSDAVVPVYEKRNIQEAMVILNKTYSDKLKVSEAAENVDGISSTAKLHLLFNITLFKAFTTITKLLLDNINENIDIKYSEIKEFSEAVIAIKQDFDMSMKASESVDKQIAANHG